MQTDTQKFD